MKNQTKKALGTQLDEQRLLLIDLLEKRPKKRRSAHRLMLINYLKSGSNASPTYNHKKLRKFLELVIEEIDNRKALTTI